MIASLTSTNSYKLQQLQKLHSCFCSYIIRNKLRNSHYVGQVQCFKGFTMLYMVVYSGRVIFMTFMCFMLFMYFMLFYLFAFTANIKTLCSSHSVSNRNLNTQSGRMSATLLPTCCIIVRIVVLQGEENHGKCNRRDLREMFALM